MANQRECVRCIRALFSWNWKILFFYIKLLKKPYLNLHFKFLILWFFPWNNEYMKILSVLCFFLSEKPVQLSVSLWLILRNWRSYGVSGWTKFAYTTLHCVMEFSEPSNPFLIAAMTVPWRVGDIVQCYWVCETALMIQYSVNDVMKRFWCNATLMI